MANHLCRLSGSNAMYVYTLLCYVRVLQYLVHRSSTYKYPGNPVLGCRSPDTRGDHHFMDAATTQAAGGTA